MKRSIFTKYITAFLLIVFISFMILTVIVSSMTVKSANEQRVNVAQNTAVYMLAFLETEYNAAVSASHMPITFEIFVRAREEQLADTIGPAPQTALVRFTAGVVIVPNAVLVTVTCTAVMPTVRKNNTAAAIKHPAQIKYKNFTPLPKQLSTNS